MEASKEVEMDKLGNWSMKGLLEGTWSKKASQLLPKRGVKDSYEALLRRF